MTSFQDLHDLTGKVAVVTGGSKGIGRSIVQTFAEAGADVVITSRKLDACERAAHEVRSSTGRRAEAVPCHVGHWDECDALIDTTLDRSAASTCWSTTPGCRPCTSRSTR